MAMTAGAGVLTAAALAAAGAFILSNKKNARKAKAWAKKARTEVAKNIRRANQMSMAQYHRMVENATKRYGKLHDVDAREAMIVAKSMKAEWAALRKNAMKLAKMAGRKKPVRRASKARRARRRK